MGRALQSRQYVTVGAVGCQLVATVTVLGGLVWSLSTALPTGAARAVQAATFSSPFSPSSKPAHSYVDCSVSGTDRPAGDYSATLPNASGCSVIESGRIAASLGQASASGDTVGKHLNAPVVGIAAIPDGEGYWLVAADGGVFSFGDAGFHGSMGGKPLNAPVVGIAATPDGEGYWLVAADGGVFSFGDARFSGSMGGKPLNLPVVGMAPTVDGKGYWLVAGDGGVFSFGDATFRGSMGGKPLNKPVVGMAADVSSGGYWLVASDGGIFSFAAPFRGSMGGHQLYRPVVGMAVDVKSGGYWLVANDGGVFTFGDAEFRGSMGGVPIGRSVVGMASDPATGGYWLVAQDATVYAFNAVFVPVGEDPQAVAVDFATDTVYSANNGSNNISVVNGATCNANDTTGCQSTPPYQDVGEVPSAIAVDQTTNTVYVVNNTESNQGSVSVVNGVTCNAKDSSGCTHYPALPPAVPLDFTPNDIAVNEDTNTIYVDGGGSGLAPGPFQSRTHRSVTWSVAAGLA